MKEVLISINPKWCNLIADGKKTLEVRKSKPKLKTPFKVYIYCTSSNKHECLMQNESGAKLIYACNYKTAIPCGGHISNGKVIGEFICKGIMQPFTSLNLMEKESCLTEQELLEYSKGKTLYGWRIADLVIYEKPRELSEFYKQCRCYEFNINEACYETCQEFELGECTGRYVPITRPPQSWCYVKAIPDIKSNGTQHY